MWKNQDGNIKFSRTENKFTLWSTQYLIKDESYCIGTNLFYLYLYNILTCNGIFNMREYIHIVAAAVFSDVSNKALV